MCDGHVCEEHIEEVQGFYICTVCARNVGKIVVPDDAPVNWESPPHVLRAHAAKELRSWREKYRPALPSDGSVGQYNQWTELLCRAITEK